MGEVVRTGRIAIRGSRALLKISPSSSKEGAKLLSNEKSALFAAGKEVKVPSILAYGRKKVGRSHHSYLVLESIRGAPFVHGRDWLSAADYLSTLHRRTAWKHPKGVKKSEDAAAHFVREAQARSALLRKMSVPSSLAQEARRLLSEAKKHSRLDDEARYLTLANGHPISGNWLKTQHGPVLSDWSRASFTSPAADLSLFMSPFSVSWRSPSEFSREAKSAFLSSYLSRFSGGEQDDIENQIRRAYAPANSYLLMLALTDKSAGAGKHFRNHLFVKKAASASMAGFTGSL